MSFNWANWKYDAVLDASTIKMEAFLWTYRKGMKEAQCEHEKEELNDFTCWWPIGKKMEGGNKSKVLVDAGSWMT